MNATRSATACLVGIALLSGLASRTSANEVVAGELVLDGFSFVHLEGAVSDVPLPSGTRVPLRFEKVRPGEWRVRVPGAALIVPPVRYPSGKLVHFRADRDGLGSLRIDRSGGHMEVSVTLVARLADGGGPARIPLTFRTGTASYRGPEGMTAREGARLDLASGYVQLVAAGVNVRRAATAPGAPFYAVLSGRIEGIEFLRSAR